MNRLKIIHWIMAVFLLLQISFSYLMLNLQDRNPLKWQLFDAHKSIGIVLLALLILRVIIRYNTKHIYSKKPHYTVYLFHWCLYLVMLLIPITGYLQSMPYGVSVFSYNLPVIYNKFYLAGISREMHSWLIYLLITLLFIHISAAIVLRKQHQLSY